MLERLVIEERMLQLNDAGMGQTEILNNCLEEFETTETRVTFDSLFTQQDRIAERLGIQI